MIMAKHGSVLQHFRDLEEWSNVKNSWKTKRMLEMAAKKLYLQSYETKTFSPKISENEVNYEIYSLLENRTRFFRNAQLPNKRC